MKIYENDNLFEYSGYSEADQIHLRCADCGSQLNYVYSTLITKLEKFIDDEPLCCFCYFIRTNECTAKKAGSKTAIISGKQSVFVTREYMRRRFDED